MDLIIDANVLFAALIKDNITADIIFNENIHLFAPDFLLEEFYDNRDEILAKTKRTKKEFDEIYETLKSIITIIPLEEFHQFLKKADESVSDKDDTAYFALAFKLNIPIWSNDKKLKEQNKIKVYSTNEIIGFI